MTGWLAETLIASTLLMAFVLAVRGLVARRFGPAAAYALWLLPLARMVLPPLPAAAVPAGPLPMMPLDVDTLVALAIANAGPADEGASMIPLLLAIWLGGAALFLLGHVVVYRRTMARLMHGAQPLPSLDSARVEVCASPAADGPLAAGIFVKSVVLPADWKRRYAPDELRLAMAHEFAHHRRCDISANLVALVALSLHWFNPIAHIAHRAFRSDQELACDAIVLAGRTAAERHAYASALVKSAIRRRPVALCPFGAREDLKRRLRMMRHHSARSRIGTVLVAAAGLAGLALTASGGVAAETGREVAETTVAAVAAVAPALSQAVAVPTAPNLPDRDELDRAVRDADRAAQAADQASEDAMRAGERATEAAGAATGGGLIAILAPELPDPRPLGAETARLRAEGVARRVIPACENGEIARFHQQPGEDGRRYTLTCLPGDMSRNVRVNLAEMRVALSGAEMSLRMARRQLERDTTLSAETRANALAGLDQALAELRSDD